MKLGWQFHPDQAASAVRVGASSYESNVKSWAWLFLTSPMYQCISMAVKLSNKGRYGVRALFDIAFHNEGRPTQIREISERELIPARFLEQIFQDLKKAGLISSKRGPRGGYHLARPASEISLGDVVRALEGPVAVLAPDDERPGSSPPDPLSSVFQDLAAAIERCFDSVSIADVCERGVALGVRRKGRPERSTYVI
jgi:Rrf2 family protein